MDAATLERTAMRKAYLRLLPYCFVLYILCYIDRINVSFASLTMNKDLGLTAYIYGLAAGAFFWGYCLLEIPSNIVLEKVGARPWIARIMITWGMCSVATAFATGPWSFFAIRVLLGAAEAGLFPGLLLYFHRWFPQRHRGRVVGWFLTGLPAATAIGGPISTALLQLDNVWGLHGWQWLFIGEGIPTMLIGVSVFWLLTERPSRATWLTDAERSWLEGELAAEKHAVESVRAHSILSAMADPKVLLFTVIFAGVGMSGVGLVLFLPQILKSLGLSNTEAGLLTSVPYVFGTLAIIGFGQLSDRTGDRFRILVFTCGCGAAGMALGGVLHASVWVLVPFSLATVGFYGMKSPFWPLPSTVLSGPALAAGLAFINSIGNFCGYLGPIVVGWTKDTTGSFEAGIYVLALSSLVSTAAALVGAVWLRTPAPRAAPLVVG